jgi:UDP-N-acetylglucosamine 2-epimerase (non-hydrolysing)
MKILTILGTRPEIIRLSLLMKKLDRSCEHIVVHTGQNFKVELSDLFIKQLNIRTPNFYLKIRGNTFGEQLGKMISESEKVFLSEKPDKVLVLGDTNSALAAITAKRMGIPVYHMEAGNRCYDDRVPEEVNRRIIDQVSDILMPYTERSRQNLLREGIKSERIYVIGNPIYEVIRYYDYQILKSSILEQLKLKEGQYFLVTMHRAENVDIETRLLSLIKSFDILQKTYNLPIIVSTHPRTRSRMHNLTNSIDNPKVYFMEPFGFFDFITLERNAKCVLTDSGTVQEECAIFGVPNVTIRDVTERPETIEYGCNILSGSDIGTVIHCVKLVLESTGKWNAPPEYLIENVSDTVLKILQGYHHKN